MFGYNRRWEPDNHVTLTLFMNLPIDMSVYICTGYTDLRKSIDGLVRIIEDDYGLNPLAKALYCFAGRKTDRIKMLFYDGNGYFLLLRRLDHSHHIWPRVPGEMWKLTRAGFYSMLTGQELEPDKDALFVVKRDDL